MEFILFDFYLWCLFSGNLFCLPGGTEWNDFLLRRAVQGYVVLLFGEVNLVQIHVRGSVPALQQLPGAEEYKHEKDAI